MICCAAGSAQCRAAAGSIGFIGLGNMGKGMAQNLINKARNTIVAFVVLRLLTFEFQFESTILH